MKTFFSKDSNIFDRIARALSHPGYTFLTLILFLSINDFVDFRILAIICIVVNLTTYLALRRSVKYGETAFFQLIPIPSFVLLITLPLMGKGHLLVYHGNFFIEISVLIGILIYFPFRKKSINKLLQGKTGEAEMMIRNRHEEFLLMCRVVAVAFSTHLILSALYVFNVEGGYLFLSRHMLYHKIPLAILVGLTLYEFWRIRFLITEMRKEEWLPIVDEKGNVKGRIARTVTFASGNKHRNPVVRIIVEQRGMLYIQPRPQKACLQVGALDHPIGAYLPFKWNIEAYTNYLLSNYPQLAELQPRLLLKYVYDGKESKRLSFLYLLQVPVSIDLAKTFGGGKLWSKQLIETNLHTAGFSSYFINEFEFLRQTILLK